MSAATLARLAEVAMSSSTIISLAISPCTLALALKLSPGSAAMVARLLEVEKTKLETIEAVAPVGSVGDKNFCAGSQSGGNK